MATKPYDQAFKLLAEQDAEALLIMLGVLKPGQKAEIELLPREVNVAATLPDQPYYSGFQVRATCMVRLRPRRPNVAGVSRCRERGLCRGAACEGAGAPI